MGVAGLRGRAMRATGLVASAVLAGVLLLGTSGCGPSAEEMERSLRQGIAVDVAQLTSLNTDSAARIFNSDFTEQLLTAGIDPATVYGPMFSGLSYTVDGVQIDGDQARVQLTATNKDLTAVLQNYTAMITNELATQAGRDALAALDGAALTAHLASALVECLQDPNTGLATTTVDLVYQKDGGSWALQNADALADALMGGLDVTAAGDVSEARLSATADAAAVDLAQILPVPAEEPVEGEPAAEGEPVAEGGE